MKTVKRLLTAGIVGTVLCLGQAGIAYAAPGVANFSVTPASGTIAQAGLTDIVIKVKTDDVELFSASADVVLTNATVEAFDCSESTFTGFSSVIKAEGDGSRATVVSSFVGSAKAKAGEELTLCHVYIRPQAVGTVALSLENAQGYEADDENPALVSAEVSGASYEASADMTATVDEQSVSASSSKSIVPGDGSKARVVTDTELEAIASTPAKSTISRTVIIASVAGLLLVGNIMGFVVYKVRTKRKFIATHGLDSYNKYLS